MLTFLLLSLSVLTSTVDLPAEQVPVFVSTPNQAPLSKYLMDYPLETKDGWVMSLLEVSGTGEIKVIKTTSPEKNRNLMPIFADFRSISGRRYFSASYPAFYQNAELPYRELCELTSDGNSVNCYRNEYLDTHDWLLAENGDKVIMYAETRKRQAGEVMPVVRPLDFVLRRISQDNRVLWQWDSQGRLSVEDKFTPDVTGNLKRFRSVRADWLAKTREITAAVEYSIKWGMGFLGFLDDPLCIKMLKGCVYNPSNDYVHGNSLEWDDDGGIIASSGNQSTVFKIEYPSGRILWTLGGYGAKHSDFVIQNDPLKGFSGQHSARKLPNGNILIFDNGYYRTDIHPRAVEYHLDFQKRTASLVWEYRIKEYYVSSCCGAVQRLENGNTLISWGGWDDTITREETTLPIATEVSKDGQVVFEIRSRTHNNPYRVWAE